MRELLGFCYNRVTSTGLATAAMLLLPCVLAGQATDTLPHCEGIVVQEVQVETQRPAFRGAMALWRQFARALGMHHETTSRHLVRRFVTLDPGERCTDFRVSESERILRTQPYLSDASVLTQMQGDSLLVHVRTVDEIPLIAGARLHAARLEALNLGTLNFGGAGMRVEGRWEHQDGFREGVGARFAHSQVFGRPYTFAFDGFRRPLGEYYTTSLSHAFLTDLQRVAWTAGYGTFKDFARLRRPDRTELAQPVDRSQWNAGGALRIGPPRRLALVGAMLLDTKLVPRDQFLFVDTSSGRLIPTTDTAGVRHYPEYHATNLAGVLGLRALTYSEMRGLDAIAATQDVATGTQIGAIVGAPPWTGRTLSNAFGSLDAYLGGRTKRNFVGARASAESRFDFLNGNWRHLVASGRAAWYFRPNPRWVTETSIEGAGVWRTILPVQIELGDRDGGVRGYAHSLEAGGQRLLARVEERADVARYRETRAAIGMAAFVDAGRIWAGDVPFGVNTPVRTSVGLALLGAIPAQSRRTIRAEVAVPLARATGARPELRFTVSEPVSGFWEEPWRVQWARLAAVPAQIFTWP